MRRVEDPVDDHAAVQVDDWAVFTAIPLKKRLGGGLVVLGNRVVVDGIEAVCVNCNALVGIGGFDLADGSAVELLFGAGGAGEGRAIGMRIALRSCSCGCCSDETYEGCKREKHAAREGPGSVVGLRK